MFKKVLIVLLLVVAALLAYTATRPDHFRVERSVTIQAPPEKIYALIQDFHRWNAWSPWEKLDPAMTRTHSGAANGVGAIYAWSGNSDVGKGRMEIVEAQLPSKIVIKLDFLDPFEAHNIAEFALQPEGAGTRITWSMYGPSSFLTKLMDVIVGMDRMVGKDFETGLGNLKRAAES
ncbi:MAG: polyketide cyclase [Lysobacteraceae bacterium]|nr:MAG: polyketide cyclase [Xanthomonadaceae bacterium]